MARERDLPNSSPETAQDIPIEIGTSRCLLSEEAQGYLKPLGFNSEYEKTKSILIIEEPHQDLNGQFNLYKFLEVFFRDNPNLVSKTIFLAEGVPANQPVSVQPLIDVEPKPSDRTIYELLSSFLITGYMAYEWRYQHGIPIIGTEDPILYRLSSRLRANLVDENALLWAVSVVARNKSMAHVVVSAANTFENPTLFVGSGHLQKVITEEEFQKFKPEARILLPPEEVDRLLESSNMNLDSLLEQARIGYHYVAVRGQQILQTGNEIYTELFRTQQTGNYDEYINRLISRRRLDVTVSPSPEAAAKFLKMLMKTEPDDPGAKAASDKAFSAKRAGKFVEAAAWYSAARAADPKFPGYLIDMQDALFQEFGSRVINVTRNPDKKFRVNPSAPPGLPIFGPGIEKDHYHKTSQFRQRFSNTPGVEEVAKNAIDPYTKWEPRYGAALQIKTAEILGPGETRALEERHKMPDGGTNRVDIATRTNVAIECKNYRGRVWEDTITGWTEQALRRFEPDVKGHTYNSTIIVVSDNQDVGRIEQVLNRYVKLKAPQLSGKIRVCTLSNIQNTLARVEGRK